MSQTEGTFITKLPQQSPYGRPGYSHSSYWNSVAPFPNVTKVNHEYPVALRQTNVHLSSFRMVLICFSEAFTASNK